MYMISMIITIQTFIDSDNRFFLDHHITRKREIPIYNHYQIYHHSYLIGGFNPSENMKVNGKDYPIYYGK